MAARGDVFTLKLRPGGSARGVSAMIVVRNVFQVKVGKAREATALLKEGVAAQKKSAAR
jgi:hypothetical protein